MTSHPETRLWAVAQMTCGVDIASNIEVATQRIERAAALGCELVALPENTTYMGSESKKYTIAESLDGPVVTKVADVAKRCGIYVLVGTTTERAEDPKRPYNTSVLLGPDGDLLAAYRKIHLFDVDVSGDRSYRESDFVSGGDPLPVTADVNGVTVGLSVCFDLRFAWLYRALADAGAQALFVPAAFTVPTGNAHWEVLLRARAIETQSFVLAPAQYGRHETGRKTFGHSKIVDPWGTVLATVPDGGELAVAALDFSRVPAIREQIPMRSKGRPARES